MEVVPCLPVREPSRREFAADGLVHILGLIAAIAGAVALFALAIARGEPVALAAAAVYAGGLIAMLACSAAYNLARNSRRRMLLRRFDQAAIFVMIAGTYTPFTILGLEGTWEISLTAFVWVVALGGLALKLFVPGSLEGVSLGIYMLLGWVGIAAVGPLLETFDAEVVVMLAAGGVLYSIGALFHVWRRLPYQNAIWHGFVVAAAAVHYGAVVTVVTDLA